MKTAFETETTKYQISSDKYQFILSEIHTVDDKESNNYGKEVERNKLFFSKFESLGSHLMELGLKNSDAQTLEDMLVCFRSTRQLLKTAGFTKEDF
ncbi:coil containing protein [Vibrio phage 1.240.O._10N.261.52.F8]|nr:coil containing protein [Vibrio phage 1.240.O._10N.261.52.F8]